MKLEISCFEDDIEVDVPATESDVWKAIGESLLVMDIPNTVMIKCELGKAELSLIKRGSYVKNGVRCPSMYVVCKYNWINLPESDYKEAYLTCVNSESNNYKFYHLKPGMDGIDATYGRIGSERGEAFGVKDLMYPYPSYMYWIRYYEKLSKGYIDQSHIYLESKVVEKKAKTKKKKKNNSISYDLYCRLKACARQYVSEHLVNEKVTEAQVKASKKYLKELGERSTVNGFNKKLLQLLQVCPRKTRDVSILLATQKEDFARIVQREENLVCAMEALTTNYEDVDEGTFESMGIEVYEATADQKNEVLNHLSDTLKPMVKKVYRVINRRCQTAFDTYLKQKNISAVKQLWHGSKNENWFSIIANGLQLNPNAQITGKMFGQGIYFAPSSAKSWNYTSYHGTHWARGNSDTAFMGLYATAYGKPKDVYTAGSYNQHILDREGCNCIHAHKGVQLYNDEIVYYDESAVVLNYIVEFA